MKKKLKNLHKWVVSNAAMLLAWDVFFLLQINCPLPLYGKDKLVFTIEGLCLFAIGWFSYPRPTRPRKRKA